MWLHLSPDADVPPVMEVQSGDEVPEVPESPPSISPGMVDWIKHGFEKIIPQPELPGPAHCPPVKVTAQPPEAQKASDEETNMVGWFVKGLGRMVPQPVLRPRDDTSEITVVQNICICQQPDHLVVEEVEEEVEEGGETEQQEKPQDLQEESREPTQVLSTQQEEMETHTEATTVTLENSQEQLEAGSGEVKLDSQAEENAQPEEDQAVKLVEESGQPEEDQAAMLVEESGQPEEDQAAMLVEESGQPEEEQPAQVAEEATQASSAEQSANIQEEEMKEVSQCLEDMDPAEGTPPLLVSTETEPTVPESKEAEPENSVKRDSLVLVSTSGDKPEPSVVTKQPEPTKEVHPPSPIAQDDETADEGCGVPTSCIAVRNWLMQMPHTSECLANFNRLLQDNTITVPKMPCKPSLGLTCGNLPHLPHLPHLPPQLSQLPQRVQQYYFNILNKLNSLNPQQET
ncbi:cyclic nucleotide-gated cation channel beta-1-like [Anguilla rostrata]|uniref:cyclic nucleotide-gated cation channel beta-1-like n=1 Tax=Anguilla rostrata TaxID=7938 RepID=UPI0030CF9AC6